MQPGDALDLDVIDVAHGGVFVARHEGRVVFLPDTMPGERVRARLTDTRKASFWRAEVLEVLDASADRRPHIWPAADLSRPTDDRPGGADFGHIVLSAQRALKKKVIEDAFARVGRAPHPVEIVAAGSDPLTDPERAESPDGAGWRTRVGLHVDDAGRIGPVAARSHRIVETSALPLATPAIADAARSIRRAAPGRVDLSQDADGVVHIVRRPEKGRADGADTVIVQRADGRDFAVDAGGFWQVHRLAAESLTQAVRAELAAADVVVDGDATHLDLYGGVGLFAATLGDLAGPAARVITVESSPRATLHARANLSAWPGMRADTARVDRFLRALEAGRADADLAAITRGVSLLDPPRAGAGAEVVGAIARLRPAAVVYVACDPVALARDVALFRERGYEPVRPVRALDLFPHSHHVEAVTVLRPAGH